MAARCGTRIRQNDKKVRRQGSLGISEFVCVTCVMLQVFYPGIVTITNQKEISDIFMRDLKLWRCELHL